jgi:predicted PurR-regulated permease PerM
VLAWWLRGVLLPYLVGVLIAQLLFPLADSLATHLPGRRLSATRKHKIAAFVVYLAAVLVFLVFFVGYARRVLNQIADMILGVPADWHRAISENATIHSWYVDTIPEDIRIQIEKSLAALSVDTASWLNHSIIDAINTAAGLVDTALTIVAIGLFLFYVMIGDQRMPATVGRWISPAWHVHLQKVREIAHTTITSYARALLTEATIVGSLTGIGLFLAGVNLALPLGIMGGLFNLVPYLGYWMALLLSIVVVAGTQPDKLVIAVVIYLLVQSADNWYFAPHFQGGSTGWTPAQTLVFMACGSAIFGPIGLIITLPLAAFTREILVYAYHRLPGSSPGEQAGSPLPPSPMSDGNPHAPGV